MSMKIFLLKWFKRSRKVIRLQKKLIKYHKIKKQKKNFQKTKKTNLM